MKTYISLLRGINVSGQKKIAMADLKALYEDLGLTKVKTYIQSGNVVFESPATPQKLIQSIEKAILKTYHFDVPVLILAAEELANIVKNNPFLKESGVDLEKLHVTLLAATPSKAALDAITPINYAPDRFIIDNIAVYLYCPNGYGRTKLTNTFFENKLKTKATTRNWRTMNALASIAEDSCGEQEIAKIIKEHKDEENISHEQFWEKALKK